MGTSIESLHWLPDHRRLIIASLNGEIQGWDTSTGTVFLSIPPEPDHGFVDPQTSLTFNMMLGSRVKLSPRGDALAIVLRYVHRSDGRPLQRLIVRDTTTEHHLLLDQTFSIIDDIAWSPDGTKLAVLLEQTNEIGVVQLWDSVHRRLLATRTAPGSIPGWLTWSADGASLLALTSTGDRFSWNATLDQQKEVRHYVSGQGGLVVYEPQWTADRKNVVASIDVQGKQNKPILVEMLICNMQEQGQQKTVSIHLPGPSDVFHVCWSPDGKRLALAGEEGVYLLDGNGHVLFTYTGQEALSQNVSRHFGPIAWSPDGKFLAFNCNVERPDGSIVDANVVQIWQPPSL